MTKTAKWDTCQTSWSENLTPIALKNDKRSSQIMHQTANNTWIFSFFIWKAPVSTCVWTGPLCTLYAAREGGDVCVPRAVHLAGVNRFGWRLEVITRLTGDVAARGCPVFHTMDSSPNRGVGLWTQACSYKKKHHVIHCSSWTATDVGIDKLKLSLIL